MRSLSKRSELRRSWMGGDAARLYVAVHRQDVPPACSESIFAARLPLCGGTPHPNLPPQGGKGLIEQARMPVLSMRSRLAMSPRALGERAFAADARGHLARGVEQRLLVSGVVLQPLLARRQQAERGDTQPLLVIDRGSEAVGE